MAVSLRAKNSILAINQRISGERVSPFGGGAQRAGEDNIG